MRIKEFVLLAVVIVLLGTYLFFRNGDRAQYELPRVSALTGKEVSRIEITSFGNVVDMTRSDDQWQVGDQHYPADEAKVKNILDALEALKLTALVSEAKAYARYDLSDEKRISVKAWIGDRQVRNLDVGKEAGTYQHTFIRLGDDPNVYHAHGNFRRTFDQTVDTLRDKTALSFNTEDIEAIEISSGDNKMTLSLVREQGDSPSGVTEAAGETPDPSSTDASSPVWLAEDGRPASADTVRRLLSQLAHLKCEGYIEGDRAASLANPVCTIILKGEQTYSLSIFEKQEPETSYPAASSQNRYPFTLSDSTWTRLTESLDSLFGTGTES